MTKAEKESMMSKRVFGKEIQSPDANANIDTQSENTDTEEETKVEEVKAEVKTEEAKPAQEEIKKEVVTAELSDEELVALLNKRKGITLASLDDLLPKEDPEKAAEKKEASKIAYAFQNELISKKEYEAYVKDKDNIKELVLRDFIADAKSDNPELTDEEIADEFNEKYGLSSEETSNKFKRGQKELKVMFDKLLKEKHAKYYEIDSKYSEYERSESAQSEKKKKIAAALPQYAKNVKEAREALMKLKFPFAEGEEYEVAIPDDILSKLERGWLEESIAENQILSGATKDQIKDSMEMAILKGHMTTILKSVVTNALQKHAKGTQGITTQINLKDKKQDTVKLSEREQLLAKRLGIAVSEN